MLYLQEILGQVVLLFLFIQFPVAAAATSDHFINPPDSTDDARVSTFTRGSVVQLTWQTDLDQIALTLFHSSTMVFEYLGNNATVPATVNISNTDNSYLWLVDTKADISENTFSLNIFDPGNSTAALGSQNFNIIDAPSTSTSATVLPASAPASTITISASPTTMIITSTYSVSQEPSTTTVTTTGRSQGAKNGIDISIGIGIGVPVLLAVGIYLGVVG